MIKMELIKRCEYCGKEFKTNSVTHNFCSIKCKKAKYNHDYYYTHKDIILERAKVYRAKHSNPKKHKKPLTKEEIKIKRHKYYIENKDRYKELNRQWYKKHSNDEDVKKRHSIAMKKYNQKRKNKIKA